jgi:V8-like Glu-specific endopeptidase
MPQDSLDDRRKAWSFPVAALGRAIAMTWGMASPSRPLAVVPLFAMLLGGAACAPPASVEPTRDTHSDVVGGGTEAGYDAVGYLASGQGTVAAMPKCGATLIAPRLAVTAAHCIVLSRERGDDTFALGLGRQGGTLYPAASIYVAPGYDPRPAEGAAARYRHDVALLVLETAPPATPISIAPANEGDSGTYVGYGRTTEGDEHVTTGYTGERRSARMQIDQTDSFDDYVSGIDGGLCWGDSGGPLLVAGHVVGVLSDFDQTFVCQTGNRLIFTDLDAEHEFIDGVRNDGPTDTMEKPAPSEGAADDDDDEPYPSKGKGEK